MKTLFIFASILLVSNSLAAGLISDATIEQFKKSTSLYRLKNEIPVLYRLVPDPNLVQIEYVIRSGAKDYNSLADKAKLALLGSIRSNSTKKFKREQINEITDKYVINLRCAAGTQDTRCSVGVIQDYLDEALDLLQASINEPDVSESEFSLAKNQMIGALKASMSSPESTLESAVIEVRFPEDHPLFATPAAMLNALEKINLNDVQNFTKEYAKISDHQISVVGGLDPKKLTNSLDKRFGTRPKYTELVHPVVPNPDPTKTPAKRIIERDTPTSYLAIVFDAPSRRSSDRHAMQLLSGMLSEELRREVRAKRALSYAAHSVYDADEISTFYIYTSTSKPAETLSVISDIVNRVRSEEFTKVQVEDRKNAYFTSYYLRQESSSSLAMSISDAYAFFGSTDPLYMFPKSIAKVDPRDIQTLAKKYLVSPKFAVVADKKQFNETWLDEFVDKITEKPKKRRRKKRD